MVTPPGKTKTLIVGGTITHVNGEEWNHPYCAIVPGDAITLEDIEWEYAGTEPVKAPTVPFRVWDINSHSNYDVVYRVTRMCDGTFSCTCDAFKYGKGKHCKHIKECI